MTDNMIYIGLEVHKDFYMAAAYSGKTRKTIKCAKTAPTADGALEFVKTVRDENPGCRIEAGCTGYPLYCGLTGNAVPCTILAPSAAACAPGKGRKKNDRRDAENIAMCLAAGTFSPVNVPAELDERIRDYTRMREERMADVKRVKQQIHEFCLRRCLVFRDTKTQTVACRS